jgi:hypothetical protein
VIVKPASAAHDQTNPAIGGAEQQRPGVASDRPAIEGSAHGTTFDG